MYTEQQISEGFAEIKRQSKNGIIDGFWWLPLIEILGQDAHKLFGILLDRGQLREEVLPNTYGHAIYHIT